MATRRAVLGALGGFCFTARAAAGRPLDRRARVAAIDWAAVESLLAIGVDPVAVANTGLYRQWAIEPVLPEIAVDLGLPEEPNLERLLGLRPDLILISSWQELLRPRLETIAPVRAFSVFDNNRTPLVNAVASMQSLGRVFGLEDAAAAFEKTLEATFAHNLGRLKSVETRPVLLAVLLGDGLRITVYGKGSLLGDVLDRLGVENAWKGVMPVFGRATIGIEQLLGLSNCTLLYMDQGNRTRAALQRLRSRSFWRALPFVAAGYARPIEAVWPFAGAPTAMRFSGIVTDALVQSSGHAG
ncbi:MAG: ABC transporter substrate-binding protein [Chelatococcus sp.]|uniref:ABC transporter substrate-binding protein n=1 Tax=Chelatococcus sp. TaxID=1953771 RepID=UPI0025B82EC4|nr:ABC transporter substrate-binding protein [Chelatococcus sp.]MBX3536673.1 ABC transporter substrate-binding protein [Chelatococcus sp.]